LAQIDLQGKDVVSIRDFNRDEIDYILDTAQLMEPLSKAEYQRNWASRVFQVILAGLFVSFYLNVK